MPAGSLHVVRASRRKRGGELTYIPVYMAVNAVANMSLPRMFLPPVTSKAPIQNWSDHCMLLTAKEMPMPTPFTSPPALPSFTVLSST